MLDLNYMDTRELIELRHELHTLAEVSGEEKETARRVTSFLETTDPDELITGLGGTGILARYRGKEEGPKILIRCELDALPIPEENDFEYKSKNKATGHKCGHDGHMAIVCGLASMLEEKRPERGEVLLLFQPAEETGDGAKGVLEDDRFNKVQPDRVFALHNLPGYPKHQVIVKEKSFAAASVGMIIRLKGKTSHSAHPEQGNSPATALSHLIQDLSTLPQFYTSLDQAAKVTVIHARLGEVAFGTSPSQAEVMATLRTYSEQTLDALKEKALEIASGLSKTYNLELETGWVENFRVTENDPESVEVIRKVAKDNGLDILEKEEPFSWSEDFGRFTQKYPGAMFGLGAGKDHPGLHASDYDFPDELIETGIRMFAGIIEKLSLE